MIISEVKRLKKDVKRIKNLWKSNRLDNDHNIINLKFDKNMMTLSWNDSNYLSVSEYLIDDNTTKFKLLIRVDDLFKVINFIDDDDIINISEDEEALYINGFAISLQYLNNSDYSTNINKTLVRGYKDIDLSNHRKIYKNNKKKYPPYLYSINFSDFGIASTDAKRLFIEKDNKDYQESFSITIPGELSNILLKDFNLYKCLESDFNSAVELDGQIIYFKSDIDFPKYKNVIPTNYKTLIEVDHKTIKNMINKINKLKIDLIGDVIITINELEIEIQSNNDIGIKFKDFIQDIYVDGDKGNKFCFDSNHLLDLLNQFDPKKTGNEKIKMEFNEKNKPLKIETENRIGILMPVKLKNQEV